MPTADRYSESLVAFATASRRASTLARYAVGAPASDEQVLYHASVAAHVAGWESYLESVVDEFLSKTRRPLDPLFALVHDALSKFAEDATRRFHTPNFQNSRDFILRTTSFDPYGTWVWDSEGFNVLQMQAFLNEILQVRHAFAHGLDIPRYPWTKLPSGGVGLGPIAVKRVGRATRHLAFTTDVHLRRHAQTACGGSWHW